jgi:gliding motility-associated-like protein
VTTVAGAVKKYYRTLADLTANVNEITTPNAYVSVPGKVYVKVTTPQGCTGNAEITLSFLPLPVSNDAAIQSCFIELNPSTASFNLEAANVSTEAGITKKYYLTLTDALNETNPIQNPSVYVSGNGEVYVRIKGANSCYIIKKIRLSVIAPVSSSVLKDKTICIDDKTTLDAGSGFASYEWSTGETTQSIQNVAVGIYWVKLKTGNCITKQVVRVIAASDPVITSLDITNNTITVNVSGGRAPYKYSLDGVTWQDSNVFAGLPRGENKVFVKDFYNCEPIQIQVTVPNLINAITPNGDNINDFIDYSALAYKKNLNFVVYDRYGNKKFEADKTRNYKWDGTSAGKKMTTGTYWFTISWNENDKNNTQTKYSGWVLVKNRE